jgi:hypothetical protein
VEKRGCVCEVDEGKGAGGVGEGRGCGGVGFSAGVFRAASDPWGGIVAAMFRARLESDGIWGDICDCARARIAWGSGEEIVEVSRFLRLLFGRLRVLRLL